MKKILIVISLITLVLFVACKNEEKTYKTITSEEAYNLISEEENIIILDVRTREAFNEKHIKDALNINYFELESRFPKEITDDKETFILIYCQSGNLSKKAALLLSELGYKNVYAFGKLDDWTHEIIE